MIYLMVFVLYFLVFSSRRVIKYFVRIINFVVLMDKIRFFEGNLG